MGRKHWKSNALMLFIMLLLVANIVACLNHLLYFFIYGMIGALIFLGLYIYVRNEEDGC